MRVVKTILSLAVLGAVAYVVALVLLQAERRQKDDAIATAEASEREGLPHSSGARPVAKRASERVGERASGQEPGNTHSLTASLADVAPGRWHSRQEVSESVAASATSERPVSPANAIGTGVPAGRESIKSQKVSRAAFERRLEEAETLAAEETLEAAHQSLSQFYWQARLPPLERAQLLEKLTTWADRLYFSKEHPLEPPYVVQPGDSLARIGKQYGVSWEFLARVNGIRDPKRIRAGQRLKVVRGPFGAVIDLSDYELTVHLHGSFVRRYDVGIGKDGTTPIGTFTVQEKQPNPKYWGDPVMEADDPENPLGEHWIGIGNSYGIHGTIEPESIRRRESAGCIRLLADDVAEVYDLLVVGSEVRVQR